jgi:hypothetical protein
MGGGYSHDSEGNAARSVRRGRGEQSSRGGRPKQTGFPATPIDGLHEQANVGEQDHLLQSSDSGVQGTIEGQSAHLGIVDSAQASQRIGEMRRQVA